MKNEVREYDSRVSEERVWPLIKRLIDRHEISLIEKDEYLQVYVVANPPVIVIKKYLSPYKTNSMYKVVGRSDDVNEFESMMR